MKEEAMEHDRDHDAWLAAMMRSSAMTAPDPCVDPETLAAWADGALDARQALAVEQHASNCSRCAAALASMERTTPPVEPPAPSWSAGSLWRWLVPLTAAATAVAVWVLVPDRPMPQLQQPVPSREEPAVRGVPAPPISAPDLARPDAAREAPAEPGAEPPAAAAERREAAPPQPRPQKPAASDRSASAGTPRRLDATRERDASERFSAPMAAPETAPSTAPPASPAAPAAGSAAATLNESVTPLERQAAASPIPTSEWTSLTNPDIRWRVMDWTLVERSIDAGKTWIKTTPAPGVVPPNGTQAFSVSVVSVRGVDSLRAAITTSDGREFYTVNGGVSWERLQGNSPAPF